jgi:hypothetical protein
MIIVIQIKVQPSINSIHLLRYDSHMTSGYSYLRVAKIRIGVHLAGETWYAQHIRAHDKLYAATFHADSTELDWFTALEKKGYHPNPQHVG